MAEQSGVKKYGLIKPNQQPGTFVPRPSIFGEDNSSDDDTQGGSDWVKKAFQKETEKSTTKKQTKLNMQRALEQDPTIYQYDEVYDKLEAKKQETKLAKQDVERKPKYIASLLQQAERRKRENERRTERQVQKEREAEGEEFKDKEAFVTESYRKKIEEFNKQDEEDRYREQLEALTDVSKQRDLSGFYRQLYRQTVAAEETPSAATVEVEPTEAPIDDTKVEEQLPTANDEPIVQEEKSKKERHYRKRVKSESSGDEDADTSSDSSSASSDEENAPAKKPKIELKEIKEEPKIDPPSEPVVSEEKIVEIKVIEKTPKVNIWLKRTVGNVLEAALERYYVRKAARTQA